MKLTGRQVLNSLDSLKQICAMSFSPPVALKITFISLAIDQAAIGLLQEKEKIILKYGTQDKENKIFIPDENLQAYQTEIDKIMNKSLELDCEYLDISDFQNHKITPQLLVNLLPIIKKVPHELS